MENFSLTYLVSARRIGENLLTLYFRSKQAKHCSLNHQNETKIPYTYAANAAYFYHCSWFS